MVETGLQGGLPEVKSDDVSLGAMKNLVGFHLWMAQSESRRDLASLLAQVDVTPGLSAVLELIGANPGISQVEVAGAMGADRATMMAMIVRLRARALIEHRKSTVDRRKQNLFLTILGRQVLNDAKALMAEHETRLSSAFSADELKIFVEFLGRIHRSSRAQSPAGPNDRGA